MLTMSHVFKTLLDQNPPDEYHKGLAAYKQGDYETAQCKWKAAAEDDCAEANNMIGLMYYCGTGVEKDYYKSAQWWEQAAVQGHTNAQINLATLYIEARGVDQDYVQAYLWLSLAADSGDTVAEGLKEEISEKMDQASIKIATKFATILRKTIYADYC